MVFAEKPSGSMSLAVSVKSMRKLSSTRTELSLLCSPLSSGPFQSAAPVPRKRTLRPGSCFFFLWEGSGVTAPEGSMAPRAGPAAMPAVAAAAIPMNFLLSISLIINCWRSDVLPKRLCRAGNDWPINIMKILKSIKQKKEESKKPKRLEAALVCHDR